MFTRCASKGVRRAGAAKAPRRAHFDAVDKVPRHRAHLAPLCDQRQVVAAQKAHEPHNRVRWHAGARTVRKIALEGTRHLDARTSGVANQLGVARLHRGQHAAHLLRSVVPRILPHHVAQVAGRILQPLNVQHFVPSLCGVAPHQEELLRGASERGRWCDCAAGERAFAAQLRQAARRAARTRCVSYSRNFVNRTNCGGITNRPRRCRAAAPSAREGAGGGPAAAEGALLDREGIAAAAAAAARAASAAVALAALAEKDVMEGDAKLVMRGTWGAPGRLCAARTAATASSQASSSAGVSHRK